MKDDTKLRIKQIETEYPVGTIEYKGIKLWPFIQHEIFFTYHYHSSDASISKEKPIRESFLSKLGRGLYALRTTSLSILLKQRGTVLFTDNSHVELRYIDGKLVDVFAAPIFDYEKNIIPIVTKIRKEDVTTAFFLQDINSIFFSVLVKLYSYIKKFNRESIVNRQILVRIISDLQIEFNIDKYLSNIISFLGVFRIYFRLIKPRRIFLVWYHGMDRMAASYVAKEMKIPVIELQHGIISNGHLAYITYANIEPNPYPNYLFCFGEEFKKFVSPFIYDTKNIFIIGNYYIDYIKRNKNKNKELFNKKYSHINSQVIITVASQSMFTDAELEFLEEILEYRQDIYFIYVPRETTQKLTCYLHENISIETELDIYQCMQNSHITSTIYSSCAVESLVFGTPVILINIQNWAKFTYSEFFSPSDAVFYANTPEEYISYITLAVNKDREQIASDATRYYAENPKKCTEQAFEKLSTDMMVSH
jgi:hypothetical protein